MVDSIIISDPIDNLAGHGVPAVNNNPVNMEQPQRQVIPGLSNDRRQYEFCGKINECCGQPCRGVKGETECIPCMDPGCQPEPEIIQPQDMIDMPEPSLQKKRSLINGLQSDFCGLCHIHELGAKPSIGLACRHVFHAECVDGRIRNQ